MDRSELTKYWQHMEQLGIIPLIVELNGKIVGHLDVLFSNELPLGSFLHLDVLKVHKAYRRRGVAKALIQEAVCFKIKMKGEPYSIKRLAL